MSATLQPTELPTPQAAPKGLTPVGPFFAAEALPSCSTNSCPNGHEWAIQVGIAKCRGCESPVLTVRMQNCPFCNEPASATNMRTDWLAAGMVAGAAICKGELSFGDTGIIEIAHGTPQIPGGSGVPEVPGGGVGGTGSAK